MSQHVKDKDYYMNLYIDAQKELEVIRPLLYELYTISEESISGQDQLEKWIKEYKAVLAVKDELEKSKTNLTELKKATLAKLNEAELAVLKAHFAENKDTK